MEEAKKILQKTHGGLDVFKHYLGEDCTAQFFRNPYRKDKRASCRLYKNESGGDSYYYFLQDFGDSKFCGNCFVIVAKLLDYNLNTDFKRLLEQIDRDMKLNVFSSYDDGFHSKQVKLKKVIAYGSKEKQCSISECSNLAGGAVIILLVDLERESVFTSLLSASEAHIVFESVCSHDYLP